MQLIIKTTKPGSTDADTKTSITTYQMGSIYRKTSRKIRKFTISTTALALGVVAVLLSVQAPHGSCQSKENPSEATAANTSIAERQQSDDTSKCDEGLILSVWKPEDNLTSEVRYLRGLVYFLALIYLFIGVSVVSERFMEAIEVITSREKEVVIKKPKGETQIIVVRVWNETVANLTLMALGSSAPEILLSVIEIYAKKFQAGELGPGTIIGSAAYNLFVITAICIMVIPNGEVRRIKHLRVFFVTATWSVFAYIWLYLILSQFSPGRIEIWEGLLTFMFFPATVFTAYLAERRFITKLLDTCVTDERHSAISADVILEMITDVEALEEDDIRATEELRNYEEARREYISTLRNLRKKYPQKSLEQLELIAQERLINLGPKTRAFYHVQATKKMIGTGNIVRKIQERAQSDLSVAKAQLQKAEDVDDSVSRFFFEPGHYTVMENCGSFDVRVVRRGDTSQHMTVEYATEDGLAEAGTDYIAKKGVLDFPPGVNEQSFEIEVIDDDVFERDEIFYVRLSNPSKPAILVVPMVATVMILDDDHCGIFAFSAKDHIIFESMGSYELKVQRYLGGRGKVVIAYWTEDGTAKAGRDYEAQQGILIFENKENEKNINLRIIDEETYEKDVLFYVYLGEPRISASDELASIVQGVRDMAPENRTEKDKLVLLGLPRSGNIIRAQLRIKESKEFKNLVDKLVQRANASLLQGAATWREQFMEAVSFGNAEEGKEPTLTWGEYIIHMLTVFWKLLFALIPPTYYAGGYLSFFVSITWIGIVTAIINDVASHFGCTLGIKDALTAICIVAIGTSVPDTFASKIAAIQDEYADNSIGNVTGSNAVNVFLGIGVAWTIAAIYHDSNGSSFIVEPGSLAFSVTLFCIEAAIGIGILMIRRSSYFGGELGGPTKCRYISSGLFLSLWINYLVVSSLEIYGVIPGF